MSILTKVCVWRHFDMTSLGHLCNGGESSEYSLEWAKKLGSQRTTHPKFRRATRRPKNWRLSIALRNFLLTVSNYNKLYSTVLQRKGGSHIVGYCRRPKTSRTFLVRHDTNELGKVCNPPKVHQRSIFNKLS